MREDYIVLLYGYVYLPKGA